MPTIADLRGRIAGVVGDTLGRPHQAPSSRGKLKDDKKVRQMIHDNVTSTVLISCRVGSHHPASGKKYSIQNTFTARGPSQVSNDRDQRLSNDVVCSQWAKGCDYHHDT